MNPLPPITHGPHAFVVYMPNANEARVPIVMNCCNEGRGRWCFKGVPAHELKPDWNPYCVDPIEVRYRNAGLDCAQVPGVHWWEDTVWYFTMQSMAWLQVQTFEGREKAASHTRQQLAILRPYLKTAPNASAMKILGY